MLMGADDSWRGCNPLGTIRRGLSFQLPAMMHGQGGTGYGRGLNWAGRGLDLLRGVIAQGYLMRFESIVTIL